MSPAIEGMQTEPQGYLGKGVLLEPFVHQVGGHSCVLRFGEQTICKPLIPREHQFYKSLPAAMRKFTPQYRDEIPECGPPSILTNLKSSSNGKCLFLDPKTADRTS